MTIDRKDLKRGAEMFFIGLAGVLNGMEWMPQPWGTFAILLYLIASMSFNLRKLYRNNADARRPYASKL